VAISTPEATQRAGVNSALALGMNRYSSGSYRKVIQRRSTVQNCTLRKSDRKTSMPGVIQFRSGVRPRSATRGVVDLVGTFPRALP